MRPTSSSRSVFAQGAGAALVVAAMLGYEPSASAAVVKSTLLAGVGLGALGWAFVRIRERWRERASVPSGAVWWVAWVGWMLASSGWATRPVPVVAAAWTAAAGLALCAGTLDPLSARRLARRCAGGVVVGSAVACLIQVGLGAAALERHGLHGNPNWLGLVVACALPLAIEQAWLDARRRPREPVGRTRSIRLARATLLLVSGAVALAYAHSRAAWTAVAVTSVVWLLAARPVARASEWLAPRRRRLGAVVLASVAVVVLAIWLTSADGPTPHGLDPLARTELGRMAADVASSWRGRVWLWTASCAVAVASLPFGVGLGGWHAAFAAEQGRRLALVPPDHAATLFVNATTGHNDWLECLATGGPLAFGLLAMALLVGFTALWSTWRAGAASLAVVAIAALGDSPLHQPAAVAVVGLVLGCTPRTRSGRWLGLIHGGVWAATILLLPWALRAWLGQRVLHDAEPLGPQLRLERLRTACELDPRSGTAPLRLGIAQLELGRAPAALDPLGRSLELEASVAANVALGNALVQVGRSSDAVRAYSAALALHPGSFRARLNRAEALRIAGRLADAEDDLAIAGALQPGHPKLALVAERVRRAYIDAATGTEGRDDVADLVSADAGSDPREAGDAR